MSFCKTSWYIPVDLPTRFLYPDLQLSCLLWKYLSDTVAVCCFPKCCNTVVLIEFLSYLFTVVYPLKLSISPSQLYCFLICNYRIVYLFLEKKWLIYLFVWMKYKTSCSDNMMTDILSLAVSKSLNLSPLFPSVKMR